MRPAPQRLTHVLACYELEVDSEDNDAEPDEEEDEADDAEAVIRLAGGGPCLRDLNAIRLTDEPGLSVAHRLGTDHR